MEKNNKIVKYKKPFRINIGLIVFVFIFCYLIFNVYSYMTAKHISPYEVEYGTMAENNIYKGLILRSEQIYHSDFTGELNYYVRETSKVSYNNLVYSVDENGDISKMIEDASKDSAELDADHLEEIETDIQNFQTSYHHLNFYSVYDFKENLSSTLNEALSLNALYQLSDYTAGGASFHQVTADIPGIVLYYTDGYEGITTDSFTADMFHEADYDRTSSRESAKINAGEPAYKLITSETWNIVVPIEKTLADRLAEHDTLQLRFIKDDKKAYATYVLTEKEGQKYLILTLQNGMVRYAKDRYIEIELITTAESGLKIPNSSIIEKEFYTIPTEYFMQGGDSDSQGLLVERTNEDGSTVTEFVAPTIYYETDQYYYVDSEQISVNDKLIKADSSSTYTVGTDTATLQGVYNINKGYAVFKQIDILYQNNEYTIVKTGTAYGLALYDHIALDGTKISENELIK